VADRVSTGDRDRDDEIEGSLRGEKVVEDDADPARACARRFSHSTLAASPGDHDRGEQRDDDPDLQSASAAMTIARTTSVTIAALRAVLPISTGIPG
jgi:hypothetical protein